VSELREYLDELVSRNLSALGADLVGVYLHGSAAMEAFVASRSDVDVLTVSARELSSAPRSRSSIPFRRRLSRVQVLG